jgi:type VI secretion system protein ImpG
VLERFLGLYCSINSFTRLTITSVQREKPLASWKPRSGGAIIA